jgi:hypothetical protein
VMDSLTEIRDAFVANSFALLKLGRAHDSYSHVVPDFRRHPERLGFEADQEALARMYAALEREPDLAARMLQSQIMTEWSLFLDRIFEWHVVEALEGRLNVGLELRRLDLSIGPGRLLATSLREAAVKAFSFEAYSERLTRVLRLLRSDLRGDNEHLRFIKKHVMIRNVVQHYHGQLREHDLREWGDEHVALERENLLDGPARQYGVGEVVRLTQSELEQLHRHCYAAVMLMIPG